MDVASGISVVVPLYNKRSHVRQCILSVAAQTTPPDEVIVVDDGSTDGSADIVLSVRCPGLRVIKQRNQGVSAARNTGIQAASGPLIAFLDADDEWHPEFLSEIVLLRKTFPDEAVFATAAIVEMGKLGIHRNVVKTSGERTLRDYFSAHCLCSSSVAIRKDVFDVVGFFRPGIRRGEDLDMWLRIGCVYPIVYSTKLRAVYHWAAENRSDAALPNEEDFMGASLRELAARGLLSSDVLAKAQAFVRQWNLDKALVIAAKDRDAGLRALEGWRDANPPTFSWRVHYTLLKAFPGAYRFLIRSGSRAKRFRRMCAGHMRPASHWRRLGFSAPAIPRPWLSFGMRPQDAFAAWRGNPWLDQ